MQTKRQKIYLFSLIEEYQRHYDFDIKMPSLSSVCFKLKWFGLMVNKIKHFFLIYNFV